MLKRTVLASWEMRRQDWASMSDPGGGGGVGGEGM